MIRDDTPATTKSSSYPYRNTNCGSNLTLPSMADTVDSSNSINSLNESFVSVGSMEEYSTTPDCATTTTATMAIDTAEATTTQSSTSQSNNRSVRFATKPQIRTYSLVLGDHPLCEDGLAIELGWDYEEDERMDVETSSKQQPQIYHQHNHQQRIVGGNTTGSCSCPRRSYLSRKQLLLDVAGCTKLELEERSQLMAEQRASLEAAKTLREDYYYSLAFVHRR